MLKRKEIEFITSGRDTGKTITNRERVRKIAGKDIYILYQIKDNKEVFLYYGRYLECYAYMMGAQQFTKENLEFKVIKEKEHKD